MNKNNHLYKKEITNIYIKSAQQIISIINKI